MSKRPTRASIAGSTLTGAELKSTLLGIFDSMTTAGMQESGRTPITADTTLTVSQCGLVLVDCTSGNVVVTLPASGDTTDDALYLIRRTDSGSNTCTVQKSGSDTIEGASSSILIPPSCMTAIQMPADATNWRVLWFGGGTKSAARSAIGIGASADIASASSIDFSNRTGDFVRITGATGPVTSVAGIGNGERVFCHIVSTPTFTYHATNMPLPGGVSRTCVAGDVLMFARDNSGVLSIAVFPVAGLMELSGAQTVAGTKTFTSQPVMPAPSEIWVLTSNGYGAVNTMILRFTTTQVSRGSGITYADSANDGGSFTVNESGIYSLLFTYQNNASNGRIGISVNSNQLTTSIQSITAAHRVALASQGAGVSTGTMQVNVPLYLTAGDVVRAHGDSASTSVAGEAQFRIIQIAKTA